MVQQGLPAALAILVAVDAPRALRPDYVVNLSTRL